MPHPWLQIAQQITKDVNLETSKDANLETSKDVNLEISFPISNGISPSKGANKEHTSPERKEQEGYSELLDFDSQNSEDTPGLGFDFQDLSSKFMEDPLGVVDSFLTEVSTSSQSQIYAPGYTTSETANSVAVEILKELHSIAYSEMSSNSWGRANTHH